MVWKVLILILSLGMDTLLVSTSLGVLQTKGKARIALTFASAEALMPLIGLVIGRWLGNTIGHWASLVGAILLVCTGVYLMVFEDEDEEKERLERNLIGWTLISTALSISIDELAVGFSIGFIGVPIMLTVLLIALQAAFFTWIGLTFGSKLKPLLGEWSEKAAGLVLTILGIWLVIESFFN